MPKIQEWEKLEMKTIIIKFQEWNVTTTENSQEWIQTKT